MLDVMQGSKRIERGEHAGRERSEVVGIEIAGSNRCHNNMMTRLEQIFEESGFGEDV